MVTPRRRRGAASLSELSGLIRADLATATERGASDATRLLFGFADDFHGSPRPGLLALIAADPPSTADRRFDAALAGLAEHFAAEAGLPRPAWIDAPGRFAEPWWFVTDRRAFHAYVFAQSPAAFA